MRKAADLNWVAPWSVKELIYYWIKVPLEKDIKRIWKAAMLDFGQFGRRGKEWCLKKKSSPGPVLYFLFCFWAGQVGCSDLEYWCS